MLSASMTNTIIVAGNILDLYPLNGTMIIWIKEKRNNNIVRVKDKEWNHSIYVASDNKSDLTSLLRYIHSNDKAMKLVSCSRLGRFQTPDRHCREFQPRRL
jgi:hypothetical protein